MREKRVKILSEKMRRRDFNLRAVAQRLQIGGL